MALLSEDTLFLLAKLDKSIPEDSPATKLVKGFVTVGGIHAYNHYKKRSIGYLGTKHPCFSSKLSGFF